MTNLESGPRFSVIGLVVFRAGGYIKTAKTGNFPGKGVNLRFSDDFSSDRDFSSPNP